MKKHVKDEPHTNNKMASEQDLMNGVDIESSMTDSGCKKELAELKDKFVRVSADLANFQLRVVKERASWVAQAQAEVFKQVITIVDDFERALYEHKKNADAVQCQTWLAGFELIGKRLAKMLVDGGVHEIDCLVPFDPHYHEAIMHVAVPDKKSGDIVDVLQKGYLFNDVVLRPARVSVAQ